MGKVKTPRRAGAAASSSPYDRHSKPSGGPTAPSQKNNVFKFKKDYGQHILKNPGIAEEIVKKAFLRPTDTVLEVGPGTGNLSVRILERANRLIAVELDPRMGAELTKRVQGKPEQRKLEVILGDVIKADLPPFDVLISNTPYQISSPLVFKMLALPSPPRCAVLMFQREFSSRLTAMPGDSLYSRLSVNVQLFAKVTHVMKVGRANFKPPPQVESSVVRIEPYTGKERPQVSWEEWDGMLRVCFNRKNKTMHSAWLGTKEVLAMVERNYKTWCTLNDVAVEDGPLFEEGDDNNPASSAVDDGDMEMDGDYEERGGAGGEGEEEEEEEEGDEWGGIMDVDGVNEEDVPEFFKDLQQQQKARAMLSKTPSRRKKTKVGELVRNKIEKVLRETGLSDKRANKCHQNDFLRLLAAFNAEGIHFSSSGAS